MLDGGYLLLLLLLLLVVNCCWSTLSSRVEGLGPCFAPTGCKQYSTGKMSVAPNMQTVHAGSRMGLPAVTCRAETGIHDSQKAAGNGFHGNDASLQGKACWRQNTEGCLHLCCHQGAPSRGLTASGIHCHCASLFCIVKRHCLRTFYSSLFCILLCCIQQDQLNIGLHLSHTAHEHVNHLQGATMQSHFKSLC